MRIRIALGATLGLVAAFAFVWLQFRAEAIGQDVSPKDPAADSISPFGSNQAFPESETELPALSEPAGTTAVFAEDAANAIEEPATSDPFSDDTPPTQTSKPRSPGVESVDSDSEAYDPFSSAGAKLPSEPSDTFDVFDSGSEPGSAAVGSAMKEQPLRIIRLRAVRALDVRSIFVDIFHEEQGKPRWFLSTESQSNSLIFKGPASYFDQLKKLASELDRLTESPVDRRKVTRSWPVPHAFYVSDSSPQQPIQILRLRYLKAGDFVGIAWELAKSQNSQTQLRIAFEHGTNSVVLRGPAAEISQVEQLAQQLDQPPVGPAAGDLAVLPDRPSEGSSRDPFAFDSKTGWETLQAPTDLAKQLREQVAQLDTRSVDLAREIRTLQKRFAGQHPKLIDARGELESLLEKAFQSRIQIQSIEVSILKDRLQNIESRVQQRAQLRQQIIDRRLHELLGEKDDLSWEVAQAGPVLSASSSEGLPSEPLIIERPIPVDDSAIFDDRSPSRKIALPTSYGNENGDSIPRVQPEVAKEPVEEFPLDDSGDRVPETASHPEREVTEKNDLVESVSPGAILEASKPTEKLTNSSLAESSAWRQELMTAENTVETASLKVEQIRSRLERMRGSALEEDLDYELRLAKLELDQATRLVSQRKLLIEARRKSLEVNIQYLNANLEAAEAEYQQMSDAIEKAPGVVPEVEFWRAELEVRKAGLRLKQAVADLNVFDVESRTLKSFKSERNTRPTQTYNDSPPLTEPQNNSRGRTKLESVNEEFPLETAPQNGSIAEPETRLEPTDSSPEPEVLIPESRKS